MRGAGTLVCCLVVRYILEWQAREKSCKANLSSDWLITRHLRSDWLDHFSRVSSNSHKRQQTPKKRSKTWIEISTSHFAAPPVNPSHSWIVSAMNDKQVPGNPSLEIHGSLEPVQGGSRFDGTQSFLIGQLPGTACVCDPDMCISGFALGAKLKFSDLSLTSNAPQYVIDTGASANNKGVSVFLQLSSLYFKIVTSNAVYQVRLLIKWLITDIESRTFHFACL